MKKLYFVRHGLSEMNKQRVFAGMTDTPLSAEGRKLDLRRIANSQGELARAKTVLSERKVSVDTLKEEKLFVVEISRPEDEAVLRKSSKQAKKTSKLVSDLNIDYIVSSPLVRAHETAKIIAREIGYPIKNIHLNSLFFERDFGELEGAAWSPDLNMDGISDIETVDSLLERAHLALEFLHALDAHNILVVSHGTFGRALRSIILPEYPFINFTSGTKNKAGLGNAEIVNWI